jgi:hypothetical protein
MAEFRQPDRRFTPIREGVRTHNRALFGVIDVRYVSIAIKFGVAPK